MPAISKHGPGAGLGGEKGKKNKIKISVFPPSKGMCVG